MHLDVLYINVNNICYCVKFRIPKYYGPRTEIVRLQSRNRVVALPDVYCMPGAFTSKQCGTKTVRAVLFQHAGLNSVRGQNLAPIVF